jgi:hypothetical protein
MKFVSVFMHPLHKGHKINLESIMRGPYLSTSFISEVIKLTNYFMEQKTN